MGFSIKLLRTLAYINSIWVVVDCLTKCAHFLAVKNINPMEKLTCILMREIVCLHGVFKTIFLNRDTHL